MRILVAIDHHFERDPDGQVYLGPPMSISGSRFWERYLMAFDEVLVLARIRQIKEKPLRAVPADGQRIQFHDLPDYFGPWQFFQSYLALGNRIQQAIHSADAFVLRVPGTIGQLTWKNLRKQGRPYALEVIADPWDILSPGATRSIVRPGARRLWSKQLRSMCKEAGAICYVTEGALQERYPPGSQTWTTYASDVDIGNRLASPDELKNRFQRTQELILKSSTLRRRIRIGFLGALAQLYKAPDILLRAAATCLRDGLDFEVVIAGDGKYRRMLERMAVDLKIKERVLFLGALAPGEEVWRFLDELDLFVLPSRQEGLPRAMVEAMARGCPCIGSVVGGIPELLQSENLVSPGDVEGLAAKLHEVFSEPGRMEKMMKQGWQKAREFLPASLIQRRLAFYQKLREQTEQSLQSPLSITSSQPDVTK